METAGLWTAMAGCVLSVVAAVWLLVGFSPDNPKYVNDGQVFPGHKESLVLPQLLRDQRGVAGLVVLGGSVQLVGAVLSLIGH